MGSVVMEALKISLQQCWSYCYGRIVQAVIVNRRRSWRRKIKEYVKEWVIEGRVAGNVNIGVLRVPPVSHLTFMVLLKHMLIKFYFSLAFENA